MDTYSRALYHGIKKGSERPNHKYTRREWKNGQWYYYYEDSTTGKTSVSSEKTKIQRATDDAGAKTRRTIDRLIHNGSEFVKKTLGLIDEPRSQSVVRPIGQNYTADPTIGRD